MNRISLSVMLLVGIEASKEPFFVEAYKLTGDSACLFHRYGKRGSGPDELMEANSVYYHKPTRNMLLYSSNDMGAHSSTSILMTYGPSMLSGRTMLCG